jgi:hypothetical protein
MELAPAPPPPPYTPADFAPYRRAPSLEAAWGASPPPKVPLAPARPLEAIALVAMCVAADVLLYPSFGGLGFALACVAAPAALWLAADRQVRPPLVVGLALGPSLRSGCERLRGESFTCEAFRAQWDEGGRLRHDRRGTECGTMCQSRTYN